MKKSEHRAKDKIILKELEKRDLEIFRLWRNANKEFFFSQTEITPEMQRKWYYELYLNNPNDIIYIVFYEQKPFGTLSMIKQENGDYEMGRVMVGEKEHARKGIMGVATEILLKRYQNAGKQRIYLKVIATNIPALKFYKKHEFNDVKTKENVMIMERFV